MDWTLEVVVVPVGGRMSYVESAIEYLENNREHLKYDEYLAAGVSNGLGGHHYFGEMGIRPK